MHVMKMNRIRQHCLQYSQSLKQKEAMNEDRNRLSNKTVHNPLIRIFAIGLFLVGCLSVSVFGQQFEGAITGSVKDSSGAFVKLASVTAINVKTSVAYSAKTNDTGNYAILLLPIGQYKLQVQASGFSTTTIAVDVHGGDRLQVDPVLAIGKTSETVTVEANGIRLQTTDADSASTIDTATLHNMPTFAQNPINLVLFSPGAVLNTNAGDTSALRPFDNGGMDSFSFNGSVNFTSDTTLDGLTDTGSEQASSTQIANVNIVPSPEMLEETRIQTSVYDAQYGRSGGGFVSMNLKNGGNQFHGIVREYFRNSALNANDYADNHQGKGKALLHWSQPGIVVTGPIRKDKIFFMFGWEDVRSSTPNPSYMTVPTMLERSGDFSQSQSGNTAQLIYDPLTTVSTSSSTYARTAFANSQIPSGRINSVASKVMDLIPEPNVSGATNSNNYFSGSNPDKDKYDEYIYRVDQNLGANHHIAYTYASSNRTEVRGGYLWPKSITPDYSHYRSNYGAHINWNWNIAPSFISAFGIGWNEHRFSQAPMQSSFDLSSVGWGSAFDGSVASTLFPRINVSSYTSFGNPNVGTGHYNINDTYDLKETLFWTHGHNTFSFGGEIRPMRDRYKWAQGSSTFSFTKQYSEANPLQSDIVSGNAYADFLMGYPNSGSVTSNPELNFKDGYYAVFMQDMWRVSSRLNLTMGLRWDTESPMVDSYQNVGFNEDAYYNFANTRWQGTVLFDDKSGRHSVYNWDLNNFGPRVGFAYVLTKSLVARGGAGVLYAPTFDKPSSNGFSATTSMVTSNDSGLTPNTATTLSNPYSGSFNTASGSSTNLNGQGGWWYWDKNKREIPRLIQVSLGFEWQVPHMSNAILDVHYAGQWTDFLPNQRSQNYSTVAQMNQYGSQLASQVTNPLYGYVPGTSLNTATISLQQSLYKYPQYTQVYKYLSNGTSHYHGLQAHFDKRMSSGLYAMVSYTWSKLINTEFLNSQDTQLTNFQNAYNAPQKLMVATGYKLPFFAHSSNGILRTAISGWATDLTLSVQSGYLYGAPSGVQSTGVDPHIKNPTPSHFFNTCTIQTDGTHKNCDHESTPAWYITPSYTINYLNPYFGGFRISDPPSLNFAIGKEFKISHGLGFNLRGESFNLMNSEKFYPPDTTATDSTFGARTSYSQYNLPRNIQVTARISF
jgi:hypothetical protein